MLSLVNGLGGGCKLNGLRLNDKGNNRNISRYPSGGRLSITTSKAFSESGEMGTQWIFTKKINALSIHMRYLLGLTRVEFSNVVVKN